MMSYEAWGDNDDSPYEAASEAGWINPIDISRALIDVMNERDRQHNEEGWTPEHDDQHSRGELATAAACYALCIWTAPVGDAGRFWLFDLAWWKPKSDRENLVRAGALILAEIERLDRQAAR
jgi:hypothetical protein